MRDMSKLWQIAFLACAGALGACGEDAVQDIAGPAAGARIKFFNFGVNAPAVNFYANDRKMTAVSSTTGSESTLGTAYGFAGAGGFYTGIEPGQYTISGRIAAATDKDLPISQLPTLLERGKSYSFYQSGFYNTTAKTVDAFIVEDPIPPLDYSVAYVRFVHAISNAAPMTLYANPDTLGSTETALGGPVAYKSAGAFTALPEGTYTLRARYTGASAAAITRTAVPFSSGRVYTITARGDITVTSTSAATRPLLDNTANR